MTFRCIPFSAVLLLTGCLPPAQTGDPSAAGTQGPTIAPSVSAPDVMMIPLTTASPSARAHFMLGVRELDIGRAPAAREHFAAAIAADPSFALAHLHAAVSGNSVTAYRTHLEHAAQLAGRATAPERLWIEAEQRAFAGDLVGRLAVAERLVQAAPENPRGLLILAGAQSQLGREAEARATLLRAVRLAPRFAPAHVQLGNSYLQIEPRELDQAYEHISHALALEPNEAYTHDFMGDVHRARNDLASARAEYTRMAELDPSLALAYQQRAHVNAFLGNFAEARADYDRAIQLGDPDEKASFLVYRALTAVHAGDPTAAIQELDRAVRTIDQLNLPGAPGAKVFAVNTQFIIALHHRQLDVAARALEQLSGLSRQQADLAGTPEFRRARERDIVLSEGFLAAYRGDYGGARAKASEHMRLGAQAANPRRDEAAHGLLGLVDLFQNNHAAAVGHFAQANPNNLYITYHHALALEGAGRGAEARVLFNRVASNNFNNVGLALTKREAASRVR